MYTSPRTLLQLLVSTSNHAEPDKLLFAWQNQRRDEEDEEELIMMQYILNGTCCDTPNPPVAKKRKVTSPSVLSYVIDKETG